MIMLSSTHLREVEVLNAKIIALETVLTSNEANAINAHRHLANQIREMDQLIFQMSQCLDWESMRPIFAKLNALTEARMRAESNRINKVLQVELLKTYTTGESNDPSRSRC